MIIFFIRKIPDLDNITPIIYSISKKTKNKIYIIKTDNSDKFINDFRINFLLKNKNINFVNIEKIYNFSLFQKILFHLISKKNLVFKILNYLLLIEKFSKNLKSIFFNNIKIYSEFQNNKIVFIDHLLYTKLFFLNYFIFNERKNIKLISIPHGIPLLKKHNKEWDRAKKDLSELSFKVDKIVIQHKWWLNELQNYKINSNHIIIGSARFEKSWIFKYLSILPKENIEDTNKLKIVYMSANSIDHIDYDYLKEETINFLSKNSNVKLKYKPHPRTNRLYRKLPLNVENVYKFNSLNLIKWADIIIGDISSIMIDALLMDKMYISLKYLRQDDNILLFEYYKSCIKFDSLDSFKEFINHIPENNKNEYIRKKIEKYENGKKDFLNQIVYNNSNTKY